MKSSKIILKNERKSFSSLPQTNNRKIYCFILSMDRWNVRVKEKKTLKGETEDIFFTPQKKYNSFFTYIIKKHKDEENENNTIWW